MNLATACVLIEQEYSLLLQALGMRAVLLDIYTVSEDTERPDSHKTKHGTDMRNGTPAYGRSLVVLPQLAGDLAAWKATPPAFPPLNWDRHTDEWPNWRTELWHEVVHQYQDEVLHKLDRNDRGGHGDGWTEAIAKVAEHFGVLPSTLLNVL